MVPPYVEAGAIWWLEWEASPQGYDAYRARIRQGPPGVS